MIKRILLIIVSICTVLSTSQISFMTVQAADDQYGEFINGWYHITRQSQLESISAKIADGDEAYGSARYVLDNDIILSPNTNTAINIGTRSNPFRGVFDGNGYTVSNFTYTGEAERCTSFFGFTEDAVIKNINFNNASISAVNGGGIVAGKATDTDFLNIGIKDSTITLYSGGSVIELITADGITAGAIVAWAYDNTRLYNCETDNVVLDTGSFEFLSALSGDGYYIGGLVGTLEDSMIEYSRTCLLYTSPSPRD